MSNGNCLSTSSAHDEKTRTGSGINSSSDSSSSAGSGLVQGSWCASAVPTTLLADPVTGVTSAELGGGGGGSTDVLTCSCGASSSCAHCAFANAGTNGFAAGFSVEPSMGCALGGGGEFRVSAPGSLTSGKATVTVAGRWGTLPEGVAVLTVVSPSLQLLLLVGIMSESEMLAVGNGGRLVEMVDITWLANRPKLNDPFCVTERPSF